jgi:CRP/FNR family transcriptional regulator
MVANEDLWSALQPIAVKICRTRNSVLFRRGDAPCGVFLVYQGAVRVWLDGTEGVLPGRIVGPGCLVGLPATMSGDPYSLTAQISEDAELGYVTRKQFLQLLRDDVSLSMHVIALLSDEIQCMRSAFRKVNLPATKPHAPTAPKRTSRAN